MAKRKNDKKKRSPAPKGKDLQALYAKMRKKFSAADLQKYTEIEEMVPLEEVIAEMEEIYRKFEAKKG